MFDEILPPLLRTDEDVDEESQFEALARAAVLVGGGDRRAVTRACDLWRMATESASSEFEEVTMAWLDEFKATGQRPTPVTELPRTNALRMQTRAALVALHDRLARKIR
jgi:hypothetical protein